MCSGIPIKLLNFSDLTKFLVLNFHAKHQIFNGLNTWLLGAVNKFSKNNRSIEIIYWYTKRIWLFIPPRASRRGCVSHYSAHAVLTLCVDAKKRRRWMTGVAWISESARVAVDESMMSGVRESGAF